MSKSILTMNIKRIKKLIPVVVCLALLTSLSSCNRGIGCPSDFSIGDTVTQIVKAAPALIKE